MAFICSFTARAIHSSASKMIAKSVSVVSSSFEHAHVMSFFTWSRTLSLFNSCARGGSVISCVVATSWRRGVVSISCQSVVAPLKFVRAHASE